MESIVSLVKEKDFFKVTVRVQTSIWIKIVLLVVLIPCMFFPVLIMAFMAGLGALNFGIVLIVGVYVAIIVYPFFRITTWQFYGRETFTIYKDRVVYEAYFRFLKSKLAEVQVTKLDIQFVDEEKRGNRRMGTIVFQDGENKLKSALTIREQEYKQIIAGYDEWTRDEFIALKDKESL